MHSLIDKYSFPQSWHEKVCWYGLEYCTKLDELSERVVIDWGKSTLSWVQKNDKPVIEIKVKNSLREFVSFDDVILSFSELKLLHSNPESNSTWINTLSSVYGIYLIKDRATGKLYVGSAYGKGGIYGRWKSYAVTGNGGNKELAGLDPSSFEFSILEILPNTLTNADVVNRECMWKEKLGSREWGLNSN